MHDNEHLLSSLKHILNLTTDEILILVYFNFSLQNNTFLYFWLQRQRRSTIDENCSCWDEVKLPAVFLVLWMSFLLLLFFLLFFLGCIQLKFLALIT